MSEIHLYDGDTFSNHNAFRSPGAASLRELKARPLKVAYFRDMYSKMHRGVIAHEDYLDEASVQELRAMSFIFLCLDRGGDKQLIVERLEKWGLPLIDVGMGVDLAGDTLRGMARPRSSTRAGRTPRRPRASSSCG